MTSGRSSFLFLLLIGAARGYLPAGAAAAARRAAVLPHGAAAAAAASVARRSPHVRLADSDDEQEQDRSRSAEMLDEAKVEEERAFLEAMAASAAYARSPEGVAELKSAGDASAAALTAAVEADDGHPAAKAQASRGKAKPTGKVYKALKKPKGTLALIGEGVAIDAISMGGYDLDDPLYLSNQYRDGGCAAVCVRDMSYEDSLVEGALAKTVGEQEQARGEFPGPIPTIARLPVVDGIQLAAAKADGAVAAILPLSINGAERTKELMAEAAELGLETLVRVCTADELAAATALDAAMLVVGDCSLEEAEAILGATPKGVLAVADLPFQDVRGAWKVRDMGFNALLAGRSMLDVCVRDRVPPTAIIKAVLSKGSVKYGLGMQKGRLEGSKEYLGSLAM